MEQGGRMKINWTEEVLWDAKQDIMLVTLAEEREELFKLFQRHPALREDLDITHGGTFIKIKSRAPISTILIICAFTNHCVPFWVLEELSQVGYGEFADFTKEEKERIKECLEATIECLKADVKSFEDKAEQFIKGL